jgi:hypothetical protein
MKIWAKKVSISFFFLFQNLVNPFFLVVPCIQWDGYSWRQGPKRMDYGKDIFPLLQRGDRMMVKKLKRKSTRKDILLKSRPHTKSLFFDMENVVKKHFSENVFYSNQHALKIEMENMGWNEELKVEDLGCEDSDVKGEIRFSMCFVLKRE